MTLRRMDNVLIVVDDLEAVKAFFIELGLKLEGETTVEGPSVGSLIGLKDVRATLAMMRTPGREEAETRAATVPHGAECAVQRSRPPSPLGCFRDSLLAAQLGIHLENVRPREILEVAPLAVLRGQLGHYGFDNCIGRLSVRLRVCHQLLQRRQVVPKIGHVLRLPDIPVARDERVTRFVPQERVKRVNPRLGRSVDRVGQVVSPEQIACERDFRIGNQDNRVTPRVPREVWL